MENIMTFAIKIFLSSKAGRIASHLIVWVCFAIFNHLLNVVIYSYSEETALVSDTVVKYLIAAGIFYANTLLIAPYIFKPKKYVALFFALIALSIVSFGLKELLFEILFPLFDNFNGPYNLMQAYFLNLWWCVMYSIIGFLTWSREEAVATERQKRLIEIEHAKLENAYLKAQINPHFLNNVLNFFYSKSQDVSEELSEGIFYLADIMRYACNSGEDKDGFVPLDAEIQQIRNIIGINQLRFHNSLNIKLTIAGDFTNIKIIPFIMTTIVENAFKHGLLTDKKHPLDVNLNFHEDSRELTLLVSNKKANANNWLPGGVGLENIKRRLQHVYGSKHSLNINENQETYSTILKIAI